jgi:hypothetical protein
VYSFTYRLRPRNSPVSPVFGLIYEGAIDQPRLTTSLCNPLVYVYVYGRKTRACL